MAYYHGTRFSRMESILAHGLGWEGAAQNWEGCDRGVYLAGDPSLSLFVMIEHFVKYSGETASPKDELADMCVIVIDESRIDTRKLGPDPMIARPDIWLYDGVIDVRNQTVVSIDTIMAGFKLDGVPADPVSDQSFVNWAQHCFEVRREFGSKEPATPE